MRDFLTSLSVNQKVALYLGLLLTTIAVLWSLDFVSITYTFNPTSFHFQMGGVGSTVVALVTVIFWIGGHTPKGDK